MVIKCIWSAVKYGFLGALMGACLGLLVGIIIALFLWNWEMGITIGVSSGYSIGFIVGIVIGYKTPKEEENNKLRLLEEEEQKRRRALAEESAKRLQAHAEEQQKYRKEMVVLGEESLKLFESMPKYLDSAEKWLDRAEKDFDEGVFAPFWDSIEKAVMNLAYFDEGMREIYQNSSQYTELIDKYEESPPSFPIMPQSVEKLNVGEVTAERMKAIVRKAQRDFQFAVIYEQRKTNEILLAGFDNLAQALEEMTQQITASIESLDDSIHVMTSTLNESLNVTNSRLSDMATMTDRHHEELMEEVSDMSERGRKTVEMLENIQHHR
jgi:uncharacterized protein YfcZ (UPF0381/DUF406 family)